MHRVARGIGAGCAWTRVRTCVSIISITRSTTSSWNGRPATCTVNGRPSALATICSLNAHRASQPSVTVYATARDTCRGKTVTRTTALAGHGQGGRRRTLRAMLASWSFWSFGHLYSSSSLRTCVTGHTPAGRWSRLYMNVPMNEGVISLLCVKGREGGTSQPGSVLGRTAPPPPVAQHPVHIMMFKPHLSPCRIAGSASVGPIRASSPASFHLSKKLRCEEDGSARDSHAHSALTHARPPPVHSRYLQQRATNKQVPVLCR